MLTAYQPTSSSTSNSVSILASPMYQVYQGYHQAAFAKAKAAGLSNFFCFAPTASVGNYPRGCIGHPSVQGDQAIAAELEPFVKGVMGWKTQLSPIATSPFVSVTLEQASAAAGLMRPVILDVVTSKLLLVQNAFHLSGALSCSGLYIYISTSQPK
ncbi:hypothetical protein WJX74_002444 [Apatococcus lobatus]|uniref:Uncharacterized protein n=1 Tax=Apatococcus lobatus TaxID=904363 RepID=A0AAW1Q239_9CHLO